jgi:salicylate hydroxylase
MTTTPSKPFTIGIVGGGISGLIFAIALLNHEIPIPITIYESAAQFGEIGAGVGFEPCFVRIMERISPKIREGYLRCCSNNGPKPDPPTWQNVRISDCGKADEDGVVWARGGKRIGLDEALFKIPARKGERGGVHRAHFLDELVKLLPPDIRQFRKRLVDISESPNGSGDAILYFADGTTAQHTAVIGCDGIKSRTRELVLGEEAARPVFSGKYAYRGLIPMQKAVELVGDERTKSSQMYCGHRGHVLTFPIANGSIMNGTKSPIPCHVSDTR